MLFSVEKRLKILSERFAAKGIKTSFSQTFSNLTSLRVGGKIALAAYPKNTKQFLFCVEQSTAANLPFVVIGFGSNTLAWDGDFVGVAICTARFDGFSLRGNKLVAFCGASTAKIGWQLQKAGLGNGEFLCCLPATVGGAAVSDAGCFGGCVANVVTAVWTIDGGRMRKFSAKDCKFGKRTSVFRRQNLPVVAVEAQFCPSSADVVAEKIQHDLQTKRQTQPLGEKTAGSALYHECVAVSRLTDICGLKGFRVGGAAVSKKHAGFVVNIDKATAKDIYLLVQRVRRNLLCRFGINAKVELSLVNFPENLSLDGAKEIFR